MARAVAATDYVMPFAGLLVLAVTSLLLSFLHWPGGLAVSLAIAALKALVVLWFFMHLREQKFSSGLAMMLAAMFIALLAGLVVADVGSRHTFPARAVPSANDQFYRR